MFVLVCLLELVFHALAHHNVFSVIRGELIDVEASMLFCAFAGGQ